MSEWKKARFDDPEESEDSPGDLSFEGQAEHEFRSGQLSDLSNSSEPPQLNKSDFSFDGEVTEDIKPANSDLNVSAASIESAMRRSFEAPSASSGPSDVECHESTSQTKHDSEDWLCHSQEHTPTEGLSDHDDLNDEYFERDFDPDLDDHSPDPGPEGLDSEAAEENLLSFLGCEDDDIFDEEYFLKDHETIRGDPPLYYGAQITLHESFVAILATVIHFKLSGACLKGILDLLYLHMPKTDNIFKRSLSFFKTYFLYMQGPKQYKYYCSDCYDELNSNTKCQKCPGSKVCYLIKLSLIHQLQALFKRDGFYSKLNFSHCRTPGVFSDVKDGDLHQTQVRLGRLGKKNQISFQSYTDGAQVQDSTKLCAWLVYFAINELPYQERYKQENVLVPLVWIGSAKPPAGNILLNDAYADLAVLAKGVKLHVKNHREQQVSGFVLNKTGDTPARGSILNMVQYNGEYSCQECEQPGEPRAGCPGVRLFPFKPEEMVLRTTERMIEYGTKGTEKAPFLGVKGPCVLKSIMPILPVYNRLGASPRPNNRLPRPPRFHNRVPHRASNTTAQQSLQGFRNTVISFKRSNVAQI